jgi:hypothetical protein
MTNDPTTLARMKRENDFLAMIASQQERVFRVRITPEQAQALLDINRNNRSEKSRNTQRFIKILRDGHWKLTNDAIVVDRNGDVRNGQHRLEACVATKIPLSVNGGPGILLLVGADPEVGDVIDTGVKRQLSDALTMHGYQNTHVLAAGVSLHRRYTQALELGNSTASSMQTKVTQDHLDLLGYIEKNPIIQEVIPVAKACQQKVSGQPAAWVSFCALIFTVDANAANQFIESVKTGANLSIGDPRLALRNYLMRVGAQRGEKARRAEVTLAIMVKTWNYWRRGRTLRLAGLKPDEYIQRAV